MRFSLAELFVHPPESALLRRKPNASGAERADSAAHGRDRAGEACNCRTTLQPKLEIGREDDVAEREADRIAEDVLGAPAPASEGTAHGNAPALGPPSSLAVRRACTLCDETDDGREPVRRNGAETSRAASEAPASVHEVLRSPGTPLDAGARAFLEPRFGYDFSRVRIHADEPAARSSSAIGAAAYTVGSHIAFAAGRYAPETQSGRRLLAHELAHVVQGTANAGRVAPQVRAAPEGGSVVAQPAKAVPCAKTYTKAGSFKELIALVRAAEAKLTAAGITATKDQIHALRGIYYGTTWSMDYAVEKSPTRNEGFQRFTRPSQDPAKSVPLDVTSMLDCGLFTALRDSPEVTDATGRQVDFGHLIIGVDARNDPAMAKNVSYPVDVKVTTINVDLGGTGPELVTWLGDLGGAAASLSIKRIGAPATSAGAVFKGSDYGGSVNLEGDVAAYVVASSSPKAVTAPVIAPGKALSDALEDYLSPAGAGAAWKSRATTFLTMNGGTFDASKTLTNAAALSASFATKIQDFACNYLASRVKDGHITLAQAKTAAKHVPPASKEVATAFVDALTDSHKTGGKIEATKFPSPGPAGSGACTSQITVASFLGP